MPAAALQAPADAAGARGFTRKAEIAARRLGVDLEALAASSPGTERITEADVEAAARAGAAATWAERTSGDLVDDVYPDGRAERVLVIRAGRAAVQVLDALSRIPGQRAVAIVDDSRPPGLTVMGGPISGRPTSPSGWPPTVAVTAPSRRWARRPSAPRCRPSWPPRACRSPT